MSYQPRYLSYCRSQGNSPDRQLEADREAWPGGVMCGFIVWIQERWREWKILKGYARYHVLSYEDYAEFDIWVGNDQDARQDA